MLHQKLWKYLKLRSEHLQWNHIRILETIDINYKMPESVGKKLDWHLVDDSFLKMWLSKPLNIIP